MPEAILLPGLMRPSNGTILLHINESNWTEHDADTAIGL
jgi:hypothetical protein